jgi:hypothetical protein
MGGCDMPTKRLAAPSAFEAHDIIVPDRLPYRDGGCLGAGGFMFRLAETGQSLMNGRNQSRDLVRTDLISPNICGHNPRGEFSIGRCGRWVVRHRILPVSDTWCTRKRRALIKASPYASSIRQPSFLGSACSRTLRLRFNGSHGREVKRQGAMVSMSAPTMSPAEALIGHAVCSLTLRLETARSGRASG